MTEYIILGFQVQHISQLFSYSQCNPIHAQAVEHFDRPGKQIVAAGRGAQAHQKPTHFSTGTPSSVNAVAIHPAWFINTSECICVRRWIEGGGCVLVRASGCEWVGRWADAWLTRLHRMGSNPLLIGEELCGPDTPTPIDINFRAHYFRWHDFSK